MRETELFTLASSEYFEPLSQHAPKAAYRRELVSLLGSNWKVQFVDIWVAASPTEEALPQQGFKIHLSSTPARAHELLRCAVPVLREAKIAFKVVADEELLYVINSKPFGRGSSGKFLTAYPTSDLHFTQVIAHLDEVTRHLDGPYILSDRRYGLSKVVFYRYGGFTGRSRLQVDGRRQPVLLSPTGEVVPDDRSPAFSLPTWVLDPFPQPSGADSPAGPPVLNGRYRIEAPLSFSNGGGIYLAVDLRDQRQVIVKEARPGTCSVRLPDGSEELDAPQLLQRQYQILVRLDAVHGVPRAIDIFREWEHLFLVEERVPGVPLTQFRSRDDIIFVSHPRNEERLQRFCWAFQRIASNLLRLLSEIHALGIVLGDLSPNNVLVEPQTHEVFLVDLESAQDNLDAEAKGNPLRRVHTPGFGTLERMQRARLVPDDDLLAAGMVLYSLVTAVQPLFVLRPEAMSLFLDDLEQFAGLPREVGEIIWALLERDQSKCEELLGVWNTSASVHAALRPAQARTAPSFQQRKAEIDHRLEEAVRGIVNHLLGSLDESRADRLWPGDVEQFATNPLAVAYGACGPLLLFADLGRPLPDPVQKWIRRAEPTNENLPPGLFRGLAGLAQTLAEIGLDAHAAEALRHATSSPLASAAPCLLQGMAGLGMVQLWFARYRQDSEALGRAAAIGEQLIEIAERRDQGLAWRQPLDQKVHFGIAYGASGIGLFLAHLFSTTGQERYRTAAHAALTYELASADRPAPGVLHWREYEGQPNIVMPYWLHGGAGIASALARCSTLLVEPAYLAAAREAMAGAHTRYALQPAQFEGLAGIGEADLDLFLATGDERYLEMAYEVAEGILLFAIDRAEGIAFPGRALLRLSTDFGTGSSGIGAFFHRLLHPGPRRFHDLEPVVRAAV